MNSLLLQLDLIAFLSTNWYYVLALILSALAIYVNNKKKISKLEPDGQVSASKISTDISPNISPVISPIFNIGNISNEEKQRTLKDNHSGENYKDEVDFRLDSLKSRVKILFIDDDKKFNVVKILKESGWKNTSSVTDIKTLDQTIVREADILFVDINGVGLSLDCAHGGLDIALMIKQKYPSKKVGIYSANKTTNAFHEAWDICDFKLEKNALPYQFQQLVESFSLKMYK